MLQRVKKRSLIHLLCAAALASTFAGCGGGASSGSTGASIVPSAAGAATSPITESATSATTESATTDTVRDSVQSSTVTAGVATHVLTAGLVYGYGGTPTSVPLANIKPYLSWAQTSSADVAELRNAGIKVDVYSNFWRDYKTSYPLADYTDLAPGGKHSGAEAKQCSGSVIYDSTYGGGYETDARSSEALGHAEAVIDPDGKAGTNYDAIFEDDTDAMWGIPTPCGYEQSTYITAINKVNTSLNVPIFVNALGAVANPTTQVPLVQPSNVLGAMCEMCYTENNPDKAISGTSWVDTENAEIQTGEYGKSFWAYERASGSYAEYGLRMYGIASFLLTYGPKDMLQEAFSTAHQFPIMPESGLVPMNSIAPTEYSVGGYEKAGGVYMHEYADCYYRGVNEGRCAVLVNPNSTSEPVPTSLYSYSMTLSGSGVLDGGSVSFRGARVTTLPAVSGAILFE